MPLTHAGNQGDAMLKAAKVGSVDIIAMIGRDLVKLRPPKFMSHLKIYV